MMPAPRLPVWILLALSACGPLSVDYTTDRGDTDLVGTGDTDLAADTDAPADTDLVADTDVVGDTDVVVETDVRVDTDQDSGALVDTQDSGGAIVNHLPILTVEIGPSEPISSEPLSSAVTVFDIDGDAVALFYQWYRLAPGAVAWTPIAGATGPSLPTSAYSRGDGVRLGVYGDDGKAVTNELTDTVLISNSPPSAPSCVVDPSSGTVTTAWSATTSVGATDFDGDPVTVIYQWQKFFNPLWVNIPGRTSADFGSCAATNAPGSDPLALYNCVRGGSLRVSCTASDGISVSAATSSNVVVLTNALPILQDAVITPASPTATDDLVATVTTLDADEVDVVTLQHVWRVNGVIAASTTDTLAHAEFVAGDAVEVAITAVDSVGGTSTAATASVVIAP